ncbi:MAG: Integrase [Massilia sp.]|nr:Integrase [Massilia sp.]
MSDRIDTVSARSRLKCRREPYWHKINQGSALGFRKMADDVSGVWQVRYREESGRHLTRTLGKFEKSIPSERFDKAMSAARDWLSHLEMGGATESITVMEACDAYVAKIRALKGDKPADDLEDRYRRWVKPDPIQKLEITKLTRDIVTRFRRRLVNAPVKVGKSGDTRARSKDTVNRDMAPVRAALNQSLQDGLATSDFAWRVPLAAFKNVTKRRETYLDRDQRRRFIDLAEPDLAQFIRALCFLPLRPGALASLLVADFNQQFDILRIGRDKSGAERKFKVPADIADFFRRSAGERCANEPLVARANGLAWNKDAWKDPLKSAAKKAGLPAETVAYSLRHSVISDLVHGGLDLLTEPRSAAHQWQ